MYNNLGKNEDTSRDRYMIMGHRFEYYISEISCFLSIQRFEQKRSFEQLSGCIIIPKNT